MIESKTVSRAEEASSGKRPWKQYGILAAIFALVIGVYACLPQTGLLEVLGLNPSNAYYNLLVQGFRAGHLNVNKKVPPGLAQLVDPYDPASNAPYRSKPFGVHDLSYYKGRLYLFFGITPALILFWPYAALTGQYLFHREAATIFCVLGFLASVGLLHALWRRYFAEVSFEVVAACALALGLATGVPLLLLQTDVYEVPISCGYMLTMMTLAAIWCALHEPERRWKWLAAASVGYGLALGARPSLLFGAIILLLPVAQAWRERRPIGGLLIAAMGPILLIGLGLMLYNALRFEKPFEFGQHYQVAGDRQDTLQHFNLHYLWFNFRVYFLEPARWSSHFPFLHEITKSPVPEGHGGAEKPFGLLTNIPLLWLAFAAPLSWRGRPSEAGSTLQRFIAATALLFGTSALVLCFYYYVGIRFEMEFLPALMLLAVVGILGLERLVQGSVWRHWVRWGWSLLLGYSMAFNLLASVDHYAKIQNSLGAVLGQAGRTEEAVKHFEDALRIEPDYGEAHYNLGLALGQEGKLQGAIQQFERALLIKPDDFGAHYNLGIALEQADRLQDALKNFVARKLKRPSQIA